MKNIWKILPALAAVAFVFAACTPKEKLDLAGYPETELGLNISDLKEPAPLLELTAVYDSDGNLVLDGDLSHDYRLMLSTASPQNATVKVEPIIVNIPTDKVTIDETEFTIPAGEVETPPIAVTFTDADFNFAAPDKDAKTYEIGVRVVDAEGFQLSTADAEAKIVINKERYEARVSVADEGGGRTATFERAYWDGAILNDEAMSYEFKVYLDKAASSDVTVNFSMEGLLTEFADDWSITPASVVIPAGEVESEAITWTCTDDFLLTNGDPEEYTLTLQAAFQSDDQYVGLAEGEDAIVLNVDKVLDDLETVSPLPSTWTQLPTTGWDVPTYYNTLFGSSYYDGVMTGASVTIDMMEVMTLQGFSIRAMYDYALYNIREVEIFTSDDGETYVSIGKKQVATAVNPWIISLVSPISTRYLKMTLGNSDTGGNATGVNIYGAAQ